MQMIPTTHTWKPQTRRKSTDGIVIHSMASSLDGKTASKFLNDMGLSVHAVIHSDGTIEMCQDSKKVAYHAGKSKWKEYGGLNKNFLGVELLVDVPNEIEGVSHDLYSRFLHTIDNIDWVTSPQFDSLVRLVRRWMEEFPDIKRENIIAHSDCSGDDVRGEGKGKRDVGKMFSFPLLNRYLDNNGVYPI